MNTDERGFDSLTERALVFEVRAELSSGVRCGAGRRRTGSVLNPAPSRDRQEAVKKIVAQAEACATSTRKLLIYRVGHASACPPREREAIS
jgi:hypothetical protein